jgi:hypothetical protein
MNKSKSKKTQPEYTGIDISKNALDVSLTGRPVERCSADTVGIKKLVKELKKRSEVHVVWEPSGGYKRPR